MLDHGHLVAPGACTEPGCQGGAGTTAAAGWHRSGPASSTSPAPAVAIPRSGVEGSVVIVQPACMAARLTMTFSIVLSSSSVGLNSMSRVPVLNSGR